MWALGAYVSNILTQTFGLVSYLLAVLSFVWGIGFMRGKMHYIKHKYSVFFSFVILGCIVFNVSSTYLLCENLLKRLGVSYYAGGFVGYVFSKFIFVNILRQSYVCKWVFVGMAVVWGFIAKKALFIEIDSIIDRVVKIANMIGSMKIFKTKTKKFRKSDVVWDLSKLENVEKKQPTKKEESETHNEEDFTEMFVDGGMYTLPNVDLLEKHSEMEYKQDEGKIALVSAELRNVLEEFGINGEILNVRQGPVVTMFEFRPAPGIKTSRIISLSDDIARSMKAISARIAIIPGQNAIGIELPNKNRHTVYLRELLLSDTFKNITTGIPLILGKDISGNPIMADLAKMPHLLIAGTTGSGKSVSVNDMILSILYKFSPKDCKLIMIDPKMLELSVYDEIPHLLTPVVTDPKKAVFALKWAVSEMENRYKQMSKLGVRNIDGFNKKLAESKEKGDLLVKKVQTGFDQETGRPIFEIQQFEFEEMPYIVVIVDEMADLMLVAGKDVEAAIQRLAQMARAAGIHIIMATQRPSVDVITGTIKANFPTRVSFQVTSKIDSRTILGEQGAEQLLGQGDMLYMSGAGRILRVHGPFVKDIEVERVVAYIKAQEEPNYVDVVSDQFGESQEGFSDSDSGSDDMYNKALEIIANDKKCSISYLQRKLQIGYNRAARIIEEMEAKGVISAPNHTGKREILI
jgi:S-DNA-T family DNA segregation ATPase FtsK/SpoIIIE